MIGFCRKSECSHYRDCVDTSVCDEFACVYRKVNAGTLVSEMFFMRDEARLCGVKTVDNLVELLSEYKVNFRSVDMEMLFRAELHHLRYYSVSDFDALCFKCIDFSTIAQKPSRFDVGKWRRLHNIGTPTKFSALNRLVNGVRDLFKHSKDK